MYVNYKRCVIQHLNPLCSINDTHPITTFKPTMYNKWHPPNKFNKWFPIKTNQTHGSTKTNSQPLDHIKFNPDHTCKMKPLQSMSIIVTNKIQLQKTIKEAQPLLKLHFSVSNYSPALETIHHRTHPALETTQTEHTPKQNTVYSS